MRQCIGDHAYEFIVASDLERDGMCLEVTDAGKTEGVVLEIFYSDKTHEMSVTVCRPPLPLELVERAISHAKARLAPG